MLPLLEGLGALRRAPGGLGVLAAAEGEEDGAEKEIGDGHVVWGATERGCEDPPADDGGHGLLAVGRRVVAAVEGELCGDVRVKFSGAGVVEGVGGLTSVDEGLAYISDGRADRADHDSLAVG